MNSRAIIFAVMAWAGAPLSAHAESAMAAENSIVIENEARAELNWKLNCQGCHGVRGEGSAGGAPPMPGVVAQFLKVEGGREYLGRVPGVAHAPLSNDELADVLNWMLLRFACEPLPAGFQRYEPEELADYRTNVLISNAHVVRGELITKVAEGEGGAQPESKANRRVNPCSN